MKLFTAYCFIVLFFLSASPAFAQSNTQVADFTKQTLSTLILFATLGSVFFLIKGGYSYITSTGNPDAIEQAKKTIRNALIGLVLVVSSGVLVQLLTSAMTTPASTSSATQLTLKPIVPQTPSDGLTQVLLDAINGFIQSLVQSATKPLTDGIISFITTTPSVVTNSVIFNFWLTIVGITDTLFVLLVAVLGFQFMSASSLGFEEIEFKHILPKIGLAFIGANSSIFIVDWILSLSNTLVNTLLAVTGGIDRAWVLNAINLDTLKDGSVIPITLIFMLLFVVLAAILLLFYISRLIVIALGAVVSPLIFLLWALPKFADFAEISTKAYLTTVFTVFIHVIIIQLASAFFALPEQSGSNAFLSVLLGIGLLLTLLKTQSFMLQLMFYNTGRGMVRKLGGQIMNVISHKKDAFPAPAEQSRPAVTHRKVVRA